MVKYKPTGRKRACPSCSFEDPWSYDCPLCAGTGIQEVTTPLPEKVAEKRVKEWHESLGGLCLKVNSPSMTGLPDREGFLPGGNHAFWELKSGVGGSLQPNQKVAISMLRKLGVRVYVVNSVETLEAAKIDVLKNHR